MNIAWAGMVMAAILAGTAVAGNPNESTILSTRKPVALYTIGAVDPKISERVITIVDEQLTSVTNMGSVVPPAKPTLDVIHDLGKKKLGKSASAVLILAADLTDTGRHALAKDKVVVIHVGALRVGGEGGGSSGDAAHYEQWIRRVEKESVGGVGFVLGLDPCILPTCALYPTPAAESVDMKGRGLCPPCMGKWERLSGK